MVIEPSDLLDNEMELNHKDLNAKENDYKG